MEIWESLLMALGAVLTLLIFSYLLGDNPLYRLSLHIFVGASVAYIFLVTLHSVILPAITLPDTTDSGTRLISIFSLVGVLLGGLLLTQGVQKIAWLSRLPVAVLMGVGVGIALGGALLGTLAPQLDAATNPAVPEIVQPLGQVIAVFITIVGLLAFSFTERRPVNRLFNRLLNRGTRIGRWFLLIGFGTAYGGVLVASLAFFADRVQYLIEVLERISG